MHRKRIHLQLVSGVLVAGLAVAGCTASASTRSAPSPTTPTATASTRAPLQPSAANGSAEAKLDRALAANLDKALTKEELAGVRSVLVLVAGRTAYEKYPQSDAHSYHHLMSVTKSVIATLVGIAIAEGRISGVDATLGELLPQYASQMTKEQAAVTLEQLLTMTGGFGDQARLAADDEDWVGRIIEKGGIKPGDWVYSNDSAHLVSAILTSATGMSALEYARAKLFGPLGIVSEPADQPVAKPQDLAQSDPGFGWSRDPQGNNTGAYGLRLTAQDLAKIGLLYLNQGKWEGKQVVPAAWVKRSTRALEKTEGVGYGYLWWNGKTPEGERWFEASGSGGQRIEVLPERDLVMVVQVDQDEVVGISTSEAEGAVAQMINDAGLTDYPRGS